MAIYKQGSTGNGVRDLQTQLNKLGAGLAVDGRYGAGTAKAVAKFQKDNGLTADGIAGPATLSAIAARLHTEIGKRVTAALDALAKVPEVKELEKWLS